MAENHSPETILQEALELSDSQEASPDNIQLLEQLRGLLGHLKMSEAADKIRDRIFDLEDLYRPTTSSQLRAKGK